MRSSSWAILAGQFLTAMTLNPTRSSCVSVYRSVSQVELTEEKHAAPAEPLPERVVSWDNRNGSIGDVTLYEILYKEPPNA